MFKNIRQIHFVGIGGSGMSGIAEVLLSLGYRVTGSDLQKKAETIRLEELGATVFEGHRAQNVAGSDVVVTSTAVSPSNPEVRAAVKAGVPVIPRVEMLAELARLKYTVAVAGTHGKTTTTSLVGEVLRAGNLDPTVVVGGRLKTVGTGGVLGKGDFLVAEADESDGSFLKLTPAVAIVTNIDDDHMDFYKSLSRLDDAFVAFVDRIPFYGIAFVCGDDPGVRRILPRLHRRRFATYGVGPRNDYRAADVVASERGTTFSVWSEKTKLGALTIPLYGRHNVLNALAALLAGVQLGVPFEIAAASLGRFQGVGRRLELKGEADGVVVVDDYGHHPTEMRATLEAVRMRWPKRRLVVLFQPHRYSRTKDHHAEFARELAAADRVWLAPVYPAGEKPIRGVTSELIAKKISRTKLSRFEPGRGETLLLKDLRKGDVFLTLGAGDVWKTGEAVIKARSVLPRRLADAVPGLAGAVRPEEPLARHSTWAIGGPAEVYVELKNRAELTAVLAFCRAENVPFTVLGWGSNVLVPDEGLRGVVARLRGDFEAIEFDGERVRVGAGVHLPKLAKRCAERGLAGVEALAGVPGTVGGALMTNAGTPRGVIGDVVETVETVNDEGRVEAVPRGAIKWNYRSTSLAGRLVVGATLKLAASTNGEVAERIREELANRERTQPLGTKNVGSVFRNPPNNYAARLIEAAGLKGKKFGRVCFSPKHANFMENLGGASAREALELIRLAQKTVREKFGIDLEPEVRRLAPFGRPDRL